jgi:arylsulfatase A-like enzyme
VSDGRAGGSGGAGGSRPNVVFVMTDDDAAHAIGAHGSRISQTPGIDRLARATHEQEAAS